MKRKPTKKKKEVSIFVIPKELRAMLRKEAYESERSRSDIVREALYVYFSMRQ